MNLEIEAWVNKANEDWLAVEWLLNEHSPVVTPCTFSPATIRGETIKSLFDAYWDWL